MPRLRRQVVSDSSSAYDLLRTKAAVTSGLSGLVWVTGSDAVSFLDALLSQNIANLAVGEKARSLLLAPNGKLRATLLVLRGDDRVGLVCDANRVEEVAADLTRFKIRVDVEISVEERTLWDVWGPEAPLVLGTLPSPEGWADDEDGLRFANPFRFSALSRVVVGGKRPDLPLVDSSDATVVRIEVGEPVVGVDLDDRTIPQEGVDIAATVDFRKGCYLGQELVARIDSRGHVNRRLCGVTVDSLQPPESGSEIQYQGKVVGAVSSVAFSPGLGQAIALAMVRVEVVDGDQVTIGGLTGTVRSLPING